MKNIVLPIALFALTAAPVLRAQEGSVPTQALVQLDSKNPQPLGVSNMTLKIDNHPTQVQAVVQVLPARAQVALLIDDGLRTSFGRNLEDLTTFVNGLPAGIEVLIGYMQNGGVVVAQPFTTDHAAAAAKLRIPFGQAGMSASPYFCLSEFAKRWPGAAPEGPRNPEALAPLGPASAGARKARFVLMITNGVDPYNGSTSLMNQNSPYVDTAVRDAQRAGVAVYSIFFSDAGFRGGRANFSGQSYLAEVAEGTGGTAYFQGTSNPVSLIPFFEQFEKSISETYVATFDAAGRDLVRIKASTDLPKTKLRTAQLVRPGTQLAD
ncbi:hypothetical protein SAMN05421771_2607 [Granulicella pectinivorans]|uniref:VWFA-related domain-containing protein n=1 Tax=Granulicella pectinivorans TaxID=474950 RepID=A0A1I6MGI2_9BACT|nr:hypothetical protein [Granulicella pectinivorans]SFS14846.1 hypothetical protein SAMN05421771_2607 [Granulicella pectinivorans]